MSFVCFLGTFMDVYPWLTSAYDVCAFWFDSGLTLKKGKLKAQPKNHMQIDKHLGKTKL